MIGRGAGFADQSALGNEIAGRVGVKQAHSLRLFGLQRIGEQLGTDHGAATRINFNTEQIRGDNDGSYRLAACDCVWSA